MILCQSVPNYVKEDILPLLSFSLWLIASELICAAAFHIVSSEVSWFEVLKWDLSPQTESALQLCMAADHSLWIQPAYYQCIPDCVNLMAGSWHGDTSLVDVSSVQLAEGSCGHYSTVHLSALFCSMGMVFGGFTTGLLARTWETVLTQHMIPWGRTVGCPFFWNNHATWQRWASIWQHGSVPSQRTACIHTGLKVWECRRHRQEIRVEWDGWRIKGTQQGPLQITNQGERRNG